MKTAILILGLCGLFSCQQTGENTNAEKKGNTGETGVSEEVAGVETGNGSEEKKIPSKKIRIQVYYSQSYCGGAYPSKEILADLHKKRWYQDSPMRIYSTTGDLLIFNFTTNHEGWAEIELPYGTYTVRLDTAAHEQMSHLFNPECKVVTEKIWKTFTIGKEGLAGGDGELLIVVMDFDCDPCDPSVKRRP